MLSNGITGPWYIQVLIIKVYDAGHLAIYHSVQGVEVLSRK